MKKVLKIIFNILIFIFIINLIINKSQANELNEQVARFYEIHPLIYKESMTKISLIDPKPNVINSFLPGQRGANQLIVYTPNYIFKTTGTNEFGTEAIVIDGIVTQLNGADSFIPPNGYVLSGHGRAKKWINENITVGSYVIIDEQKNMLYTFITPDSFIFNAREKLYETQSIINYYLKNENGYNYSTSRSYMNKAYNNLEKAKKRPDDVQKIAKEAMDNASKALENALPYRNNELKGVWIRPTEMNNDEVIKTLDRIKESGIDNVFLETYLHGKTIYKSDVLQKYGFIPQYEEFTGFDPLKAFIDEAHKRNMKIHIWFESFYVGNKNPKTSPCHILRVKPGWANTTKALYTSDEPVYSISEHNGYFLDPSHPDVQMFLLEIINEIITKYKPDGINLDYIRYPQSANTNMSNYERSNWGYTPYARYEFKKLYNIDPVDIKYKDENWNIWAAYRQNKITEFVESVSKICRKKNILLTAVIFPDRQKSLDVKMQDWRTWSLKGYVDGFTPLILTCDKLVAQNQIQDIKINISPGTKVYSGLFVPFMDGSCDDMLRLIHETRKLNSNGVVLFDYAHFKDRYKTTLQERVFNPGDLKTSISGKDKDKEIKKDTKVKKRKFFQRRNKEKNK